MRLQSPIQYTFDVVWYLSSKEVIACTWACDNVTGKDGTTSAILSPDVLNVPNVDALLFAWNAYHRAADMAFTQSAPQEHRYVQ